MDIKTASEIWSHKLHSKCRNSAYPGEENVVRFTVPDDKVLWKVPFPDYNPLHFTAAVVLKKPVWADQDILENNSSSSGMNFNALDGKISRISFMGQYTVSNGLPQNPLGRTGIQGRGLLGRWGPNHAADPVVTRWKRNEKGEIVHHDVSKKPILQFVSILRSDVKQWAIPGGMVDPGEDVSVTLKREFSEEAMDSITADEGSKKSIQAKVDENFKSGLDLYRGYVDDPRNTDNSWMETVARNFHDETGEGLGRFKLTAGDDAVGVRWVDISSDISLYASHKDFIEITTKLHKAHW